MDNGQLAIIHDFNGLRSLLVGLKFPLAVERVDQRFIDVQHQHFLVLVGSAQTDGMLYRLVLTRTKQLDESIEVESQFLRQGFLVDRHHNTGECEA